MAITIGLDFGTHQTKICIENSNDPHHVTYEFMQWRKGCYALPSIIQINKNHTLRYGDFELVTALKGRKKKMLNSPKPLVLPPCPSKPVMNSEYIDLPKRLNMPIHKFVGTTGKSVEIPYNQLYGINQPPSKDWVNPLDVWQDICKKIDEIYEGEKLIYNLKGEEIGFDPPKSPVYPPKPRFVLMGEDKVLDINYFATKSQIQKYKNWQKELRAWKNQKQREIEKYNKEIQQYEKELKIWEEECKNLTTNYNIAWDNYETSLQEFPMIFRYFKQATFSAYKWDYEIEAESLSILYLANIIFKLEQRFDKDFSIQMGVPASKDNYERLKEKASKILIQAIKLVEDVFDNDYEKFLLTPYETLFKLIPDPEYTNELKNDVYGLMILPEAFASLKAITSRARIPSGMSVMLDIGGGTTDISFFTLERNGDPHIYHFHSMAKGLNFFLEFKDGLKDFSTKREMEDLSQEDFDVAYSEYKKNLDKVLNDLFRELHSVTIKNGFRRDAFTKALANRPIIYTGGGSYLKKMRMAWNSLKDVMHLDKKLLGAENIIDENYINIPYSILSTCYGLSHAVINDNIEISSKEDLFDNLRNFYDNRLDRHKEYGLLDT